MTDNDIPPEHVAVLGARLNAIVSEEEVAVGLFRSVYRPHAASKAVVPHS